MSTVDSLSVAGAGGTSGGATAATASDDAGSVSALADYDDFLSLLTAQLRNQDPLNPQDGTEFVEQIATFTGVEQQLNTNAKLDELIAAQTSSALNDLAEWVGRDVTADGLTIDYPGGEIRLTMPDSGGATEAALVIKDLNGTEVARVAADPRGGEVTWNGAKNEGGAAAAGQYRLEYAFTTETAEGPQVRVETPDSSGRVIEARLGTGGDVELVLQGGLVVVKPSDVKSVQAAPSVSAESEPEEEDSLASQAVDAAESVADAAESVVEAVTG